MTKKAMNETHIIAENLHGAERMKSKQIQTKNVLCCFSLSLFIDREKESINTYSIM